MHTEKVRGTTRVVYASRREKKKFGPKMWLSSGLLLLSVAVAQGKYIVPGARWRATDGSLVNAHAGSVLFDNGTFWWFGEYKTQEHPEGGGVAVYSSPDLATWTSHGLALGKLTT